MKILHAQFGYDMTINRYYKIVKDGEKTVIVQQVGKVIKDDNGLGGGNSKPNSDVVTGESFRAYKRVFNKGYRDGEIYFVSKHFPGGSADMWDGKPNYYNTWD